MTTSRFVRSFKCLTCDDVEPTIPTDSLDLPSGWRWVWGRNGAEVVCIDCPDPPDSQRDDTLEGAYA